MPSVDSIRFLKEIKSAKNFLPVYLIAGEELSLLSECFQNLKSSFLSHHKNDLSDFNFESFYGDQAEGEKILESCSTLPFGAEKKMVVVHNFEKLSESSKGVVGEYLKSPNPSTCLALVWQYKPNQAASHSIGLEVLKTGTLVQCWKPSEETRLQWIKGEVQKSGKKISEEACRLLSQEGGETFFELKSELEKLSLYTVGKTEIEIGDVRETMSFRRDRSFWDCFSALESGQTKKAGEILEFCLNQGEEPIMILSFLLKSFKRMAGIEPPSFYQKGPIKKISKEKLIRLIEELKKTDLMLKSGHSVESSQFERILAIAQTEENGSL